MSGPSRTSVPKIWPAAAQSGFHKTFELELDDHLDIQYTTRQLLPLWPTVGAMALIVLFGALFLNFDKWRAGDVVIFAIYVVASVIAGVLLTILLLQPMRRLLRGIYRRRLTKMGVLGKPIEATVDENGISYTVVGQTVSCPWNSLYALEEEAGTFYFWLSKTFAHPWPARIFISDEERRTFRDSVLKWSGRPIASPPVLARLGANGRVNLPD
ncbi:YcxB family protein [Mesorhizobium sp. YR577]|uniref:YcxB family protein n=1 Tax=Mesorhizobium sp. YR577 TaxID=1884373 RepID=UPI0008E29505|nr:YcxB family protein [Mesorhizobium sp. YR577]SFT63351.1 hypothetical protein SAMN05518861_10340 [Mesorhizobium sp. YR577]